MRSAFASSALVSSILYQAHIAVSHPQVQEAAAQIPTGECVPYYNELVQSNLHTFPGIWQTASIVAGDTEAQSWWNAIRNGIPPIAVRGSGTEDISVALQSYPASDPDCWWSAHQCVTSKYPGIPPDVLTVPQPRTLGYGFDDGPSCAHNAFYSFLSSNNQLATMYYIGSNVLNWPTEAQRAVWDGHEICLHGWSHKYMTALSNEQAFAELYYGMFQLKAVRLVTGVNPNCWRPPFGDVDDRIRYIAYSLGLMTILWEHDTYDWQAGQGSVTAADIDRNYENIISMASSGAFNQRGTIILMHELNNFTMLESAKYYPSFRNVFANVVPVGTALNMSRAPVQGRDENSKRAIIVNPFQADPYGRKGTVYPYVAPGTQPYGPFFGTTPRLAGVNGARSSVRWDSRPDFQDAIWAVCVGFSVFLLVFRVI